MFENEITHLCKYPFLTAASKYVAELGVTLEDLTGSAAFGTARARGRESVLNAIKHGTIKHGKEKDRAKAETELLSYPFARILVSCVGDERLARRYALSVAKTAHERLLEDSRSTHTLSRSHSRTDFFYEISEEFGLRVLPGVVGGGERRGGERRGAAPLRAEREQVQMPFVDYLRFTVSANLRDKKWKLVNRGLEQGFVRLEKSDLLRILEAAIYERVVAGLPLEVPAGVCECEAVKEHAEAVKRAWAEEQRKFARKFGNAGQGRGFKEEELQAKDASCFPPCVSRILSDLREGVNVPHTARFAVTAFLLNLGFSEEEVVGIYRSSPDFDEERTRYQVRNISGEKEGEGYTAPSCATMRTYGNCVGVGAEEGKKDEICEKVSHPLSYYKFKLRLKNENRRRSAVLAD